MAEFLPPQSVQSSPERQPSGSTLENIQQFFHDAYAHLREVFVEAPRKANEILTPAFVAEFVREHRRMMQELHEGGSYVMNDAELNIFGALIKDYSSRGANHGEMVERNIRSRLLDAIGRPGLN